MILQYVVSNSGGVLPEWINRWSQFILLLLTVLLDELQFLFDTILMKNLR